MNDFRQRLADALADSGLSHADLARTVGVSRGAVSGWLRTGTIATENLFKAAEALGVTADYLLTGARFAADAVRPVRLVPIVGHAIASPDGGGYFTDMGLPAGAGDGFVPFPTTDAQAYALRVKGDSMEPRIRPGEVLIVEPGANVSPGNFVLVKAKDGRRMVKVFLYRTGSGFTFGSINSDFKPITLEAEDIEAMHRIAHTMPADAIVNP